MALVRAFGVGAAGFFFACFLTYLFSEPVQVTGWEINSPATVVETSNLSQEMVDFSQNVAKLLDFWKSQHKEFQKDAWKLRVSKIPNTDIFTLALSNIETHAIIAYTGISFIEKRDKNKDLPSVFQKLRDQAVAKKEAEKKQKAQPPADALKRRPLFIFFKFSWFFAF